MLPTSSWPPRWSVHVAVRSATPVPEHALNDFLAALDRVPPSASSSDGPVLAILLFNHMSRGRGPRTEEVSDVLLRMMPEFACVPNVVMYSRLLKCFCDDWNSWRALEPHQLMGRKGCSPDVVVYSTVINDLFKEGKVTKACDLFYEMIHQGISPMQRLINLLLMDYARPEQWKRQRMGQLDCAMNIFSQMINHGIPPNEAVYHCLIQAFCCQGDLVIGKELISEMIDEKPCGYVPWFAIYVTGVDLAVNDERIGHK
ncbi:hypothetical protein PR202_gb26100 [Eleusine coracana subsp. coracana]|uniref:Pentatricopeptide repeat-containing protein n=1 Tax=Eleusine coracana subsp. coracana TaxID=191504 RepID=A0AAV5FQP3_ELECO|nr:hypothetical protein PR202_gb26100 [Eleusine coracana subsp. coracana]